MAIDKTKDIKVGGTLHSIATGNIIAHADEIMDENWGKNQSAINQEIRENITNIADEEDITLTEEKKLQFKDRDSSKGMGYKILRLPEDGILTQEMINEPNTIYEIRYNFDLNGQEITIPENCALKFEGGSFSNGTLKGNNAKIEGTRCFSDDLVIEGTTSTISVDWYSTDFIALKRCLALADATTHVLRITRDLNIDYTESIETSSLIDFQGHSLYLNTNGNHDAVILSFTNTSKRVASISETTDLISLFNSKVRTGYSEGFRNSIIHVWNQKITEIVRTINRPQVLTEIVYIDEYGDLHGDIWNSDIPSGTSETTYARLYKKESNIVGIRNCNLVITKTDELSHNYRSIGFSFEGCVNPVAENITVFASNNLAFADKENGVLKFTSCFNVTVRNCYLKNTTDKNSVQNGDSAYGLSFNKCIGILLDNIRTEAPNTREVWGVMGSNYLYDMKVLNCSLSRIDIHWRVVNMDIDHCDIGTYGIYYTGKGIINITNSKFYSRLLEPRSDYASFFDGVVNITNCSVQGIKSGNTGIISLGTYTTNWKLRGYESIYLGARTINIDNLFMDFSQHVGEVYIVQVSTFAHSEDLETAEPRVVFPNINIRNVTFHPGIYPSAYVLKSTSENLIVENTPSITVQNCTDVFNNAYTPEYYKVRSALIDLPDSKENFKASLLVENCNLHTGQEPSSFDCQFNNCIIEGFKNYGDNDFLKAHYTFTNCLFRYKSTRIEGHVAFSKFRAKSLIFNGCTFDKPHPDSTVTAPASYFSTKSIQKDNTYVGWIIGGDVENILTFGCKATKDLADALSVSVDRFWDNNTLTRGTIYGYQGTDDMFGADGETINNWKVIR